MFNNLKDSLSNLFSKIRKDVALTEEHLQEAMRTIRVSLLEADVALPVVRKLTNNIKEKAIGQQVVKNIAPVDMVIKIVHDELVEVLGSENEELNIKKSPSLVMMVGIQGAGKTTTSGKLAHYLHKKEEKKVLMASTDANRPAAKQQLETLGKSIQIDTLDIVQNETAVETCKRLLAHLKSNQYDVVIIDTAGRQHTNAELMEELKTCKELVNPSEILLVADSLTGQDAVNIAKEFNEALDVSGIILTRIDGDGRGGAALSMKEVTNKPIKFIGIGEKISDLDKFHPERIVSRILDKGDIVSLVEKASEVMNEDEATGLMQKLKSGRFNLNDLLKQLKNIKRLGSLSSIVGMIPGVNKLLGDATLDDKVLVHYEAIIFSMTPKERKNPDIINASRRKRIASGSGTSIQEINKILKQFKQMQKVVKKMSGSGNLDPSSINNLLNQFK